MLSLTVFSQKDTTTNGKTFPIPVVKQIVKDLLSGDSAKAQLKLSEEELIETKKKVALKDSIINSLREKEVNYRNIIGSEKKINEVMGMYTNKLEIDLKNEKVKNKSKSIIGGGIIIVLTYLLITK